MGGLKFKGANLMFPKRPKIAPKDRIKEWKIFEGDTVKIVGGRKDLHKTGKVLSVIKNLNAVIVEDCNMVTKHIKPNQESPKGSIIRKEAHISVTNVQLVDPATGNATKTILIRPRPGRQYMDPVTGRHEKQRYSPSTGSLIPIPTPRDPFAGKNIGPLDTAKNVVETHTFIPSLTECPFPNAFMNELERMRRKNKESHAF
ncbi:hypothetical protein HDU86_004182 [Geranomyces michiganensis]|nr:hypothetical protein HDU86_004182 [Geranomyces michiganensis]